MPQYGLPEALKCEMWTGVFARRPISIASLDRVEQGAVFAADVAGVDAAVAADDFGHRGEFVDLRIGAGDIDEAGRHPPGACPHAAVDEFLQLGEFFGRRVDLPASQHERPRRAVRNQVGDVRAGAVGVDVGEILPDVDRSAAAVAGDERRAALADVVLRRAGLVGDDRLVAVVVEVDEPGGDDQAGAVDRLADHGRG